jgi:hypothetical protein
MTATNQPLAAWVRERSLIVVRAWAERAVQTNRASKQTPLAVARFCQEHGIVLDLFEPRRTGQAILNALTMIDNAKDTDPCPPHMPRTTRTTKQTERKEQDSA